MKGLYVVYLQIENQTLYFIIGLSQNQVKVLSNDSFFILRKIPEQIDRAVR